MADRVLNVVVAGGSIAAIETLGALHRLAGERVRTTLLAPEDTFLYRPRALEADHPGAAPPAPALGEIAASLSARHLRDRATWIDEAAHLVHTASGAPLGYDALVVAVGARARAVSADALSLDPRASAEVGELLAAVRAGEVRRMAFVVPERIGWLLAVYETALAAAHAGAEASAPPEIVVLTAERSPLAVFGQRASRRVAEVLFEHGVRVLEDVRAQIPGPGRVSAHGPDGARWETAGLDRIVAAPRLRGPFLRGLPCADGGFIPVDPYCRVPGHQAVFAAGDATTYPVKHGGIGAQQADVVARGIAALAGAAVERVPFRPRLEARLITGDAPLYLAADLIGGQSFGSIADDAPDRGRGAKVIARELGRVLEGGLVPDSEASAEPDVEHRV